ncbi:hypothetical protein LCGC14_3096810 [marine sediment metagenome]|uniref:Ferric uptake regulation protein n=1 Tax=marine sediment metagenome TaxID=412755 RepID=A0A0F8W8U3_9ZZZZ
MHHAPDILKKEGHKLTPQRLLIWHILEDGKHYTANEIHEKVQNKFPGIDLATVYRTLELLTRLNFVQESSFASGPARYEVTDQIGHTHVACRECKRIEHFEGEEVLAMIKEVCNKKNFDAENIEINISATCKSCQGKAN